MAEVTISINGRDYRIGCEAGQERRVQEMARRLDRHARDLSVTGAVPESRLMLLVALMIADEAQELREKLTLAEEEARDAKIRLSQERARPTPPAAAKLTGQKTMFDEDVEAVVADLLNNAAARLEALADSLTG